MSTPRIQLDGVWKKFRRGEVHDSLRDLIPSLVARMTGRVPAEPPLRRSEFWALRDVSFAVEPGQTLGVIGPNGAGKSTLLKILTRILRPTRGAYSVTGRIGALIEVAAGFHPDLTGRENIFLQGAIMGMGQRETKRKLEEIVAFSEIESFIDTPVKRYSSGMNARLGFSIAAHLDPDVLIVDEVLAVGDHTFQRKAFGRLRDLARTGLPVVIVSHQLDRVLELCTDALLLSQGTVLAQGTPTGVVAVYMRGSAPGEQSGGSHVPLSLDAVCAPEGNEVPSGEAVRLRIQGSRHAAIPQHMEPIGILVRSAQTGELIFATGTSVHEHVELALGPFTLDVQLQMNVLPGMYLVDIGVFDRAAEKQLLAGPSLNLRVTEGRPFHGFINMNPVMTLATEPAPSEAGLRDGALREAALGARRVTAGA